MEEEVEEVVTSAKITRGMDVVGEKSGRRDESCFVLLLLFRDFDKKNFPFARREWWRKGERKLIFPCGIFFSTDVGSRLVLLLLLLLLPSS